MRGFFSVRQKRGIRMRRCVHQFIRNWKFIRIQISMISLIADTRAKRYIRFTRSLRFRHAPVYTWQKETGIKMFWILHEFGNNY